MASHALAKGARWIAVGALRLYRYALSPMLPRCCRFSPSCSRYAIDAIDAWGLRRGVWLTLMRIARCHPFSVGGFDPPPRKHSL